MCCGSDPINRVNILQLEVSDKARYSYYRFSSGEDELATDSTTAAVSGVEDGHPDDISIDSLRTYSIGESIYGI